jgi:hypothetical protein
MEEATVAADLAKHEAVCAERWKTVFNKMEDHEEQINRVETILIAVAGGIIAGGGGVIATILFMH